MNVVIIMTDQQAASSLPLYGNPVCKAPNLQTFAEGGSLFENAFTSCPICVPARVSLFTGQYPSTHGSLGNFRLMAPGKEHLLRRTKDAGFVTGLVGKNHCFQDNDLALFDVCRQARHWGPYPDECEPKHAQATRFLQQAKELKGCWGSVVTPHRPEALGTHWVTDRAIEFVRDVKDKPFFLWYSIPDPHIPFQTCEPYASMYPPKSVDLPPRREGEMQTKPRAQQIDHDVMRGDEVSEETVRRIRSIYYGMNTFIDDQLGRFFRELDTLGLADDTLVFYVSDHGEYLGEHGMIRKSKAAYDCLTHIPFIVRGPGVRPGARVREFVGLEDVMPTVLGALDLEIPAQVQGRNLWPLLEGKAWTGRPFAYGEHGVHPHPWPEGKPYKTCAGPLTPDFKPQLKVGGYGRLRYIRTHRWKLVAYVEDRWELYDLEADPAELENLFGRPGTEQVTADLQAQLLEHLIMTVNPDNYTDKVC